MPDSTRLQPEPWLDLLPQDPRPWILDFAEEPAARWLALTHLLDLPDSDPEVVAAHDAVIADPGTQALLDRLVPWDIDAKATGHDKPQFTPNLLSLLTDMGVRASDDARIERILATMLEHTDADGRFQAFGRWRAMDEPVWGALACDAHAIAETLARFGHAEDPRVVRAFDRIAQDMTDTDQGRAWPCREDPAIGFRGPGRKGDFCPQIALEALRAFSYLPAERRPREVVEAGRVSLRAWRERGTERPYMFGHGRNFKRAKWPLTWYGAFELVDVIGRYPELWDEPTSPPEDRQALAELVACVVAYNFAEDGRVTPKSCFKGFEAYSFGQKKVASAFATARVAVALRRVGGVAADAAAVDVLALGSAKGGTGVVVGP